LPSLEPFDITGEMADASNKGGGALGNSWRCTELEESMANHSRLASTPLSVLDLRHLRQDGTAR